jgi:hypothetical protein
MTNEKKNGLNRKNNPDPTRNVLDLVETAVNRVDDLRDAETKRIDEKFKDNKEHITEIMNLRADYEEKLREAEKGRLDSIRIVDINAVNTASSKAADQALVLAKQVTESAETLRKLVADTALSTANTLTQIITPITDRLSLLEKAQYTVAGKEGVTDPIFNKLIEKIDSLFTAQNKSAGKSQGLNSAWLYLIGGAGLVSTIITIFVFASGHVH